MHAKNLNADNAVVKRIIKELKKHKHEHNGASTDEFIISVLARGCPEGITYSSKATAADFGPCMWWAGAGAFCLTSRTSLTDSTPFLQRP